MANKPRLFIKQQSHVTTFKVRGNPFAWVMVYNREIAKIGAVGAIRRKATDAAKSNCHRAAGQYHMIADILDGVSS